MIETFWGLVCVRPGLWINRHEIINLAFCPERQFQHPEPSTLPAMWRCIQRGGHVDLLTPEEGEALQAYILAKIPQRPQEEEGKGVS